MKIVLFHPVPLPPKDYGGVERVVLWLATGLRDLGHEVWIAALEGSQMPVGIGLIPIPRADRSAQSLLGRLPAGVEIVHFHAPPEAGFVAAASVAHVTTIHGNGKPGEVFPKDSVFLSADHARRHGRAAFIYNGLDASEFSLRAKDSGAAPLFLSKTTLRTKNLRGAIEIARRIGSGLTIAGGNRPFGLRARAALSGQKWIGPVSGERKAKILADASALLFPVVWDEPFGLVMAEAMFSGTPVLGADRGSIPEVLAEGGGIALPLPSGPGDEPAFANWRASYEKLRRFEPEALRALALRRFSHRQMAESYVAVYKKVIRGDSL